jgi:lipid-A-disaccharide synthase
MRIDVSASELLAMGFIEVFSRIKKILSILKQMGQLTEKEKPDVAILIDYPEFHFKLAKEFYRQNLPVICMIPPKIWAWRSHRVHKIGKLYRHVFTIFPFEGKIFSDANVPFTYLGNPLLDELPLNLSKEAAREKKKILPGESVLLLMPGSRPSEIKYHLKPMMDAAEKVKANLEPGVELKILMPLAPTDDLEKVRTLLQVFPLQVELSQGDAWDCMRAADAGIIKSGTSTLEAAVLDCPHVVIYDGHPISKWLFKNLMRYTRPISLVNLVEGRTDRKIVPELILENFKVELMAKEVMPLMDLKSPMRAFMLEQFIGVRQSLLPEDPLVKSPSQKAAQEIFSLIQKWRQV